MKEMYNDDFDPISEIWKLLKRTGYTRFDVYRCSEENGVEIADMDSIFKCENDEQSLKSLALFLLMGNGSLAIRNHFAQKEQIKNDIYKNDIALRNAADDNALLFITGLTYNKRFRTLAFNILHFIQYEINSEMAVSKQVITGLAASPGKGRVMRQLGEIVELTVQGIPGKYRIYGSNEGIQIRFTFNVYQPIIPFYLEFHLQSSDGTDHYLQLSGKSNLVKKESILSSQSYTEITSGEEFTVIGVYPLEKK